MKTKYDIEITINDVTNKGTLELYDNYLLINVDNQSKKLLYDYIKNKEIIDNGIKITLKNNTIINFKTPYNNDINKQIILNNKKNIILDIIKSPYKSFIAGLVLMVLLGLLFMKVDNNSILFYFREFIRISLIIFIIVSVIRIIFNFLKNSYNDYKNIKTRPSFLYNLCLYGVPIFLIVITLIYHTSGPQGAVNNIYHKTSFVSCEKQNKSYGITTYSCTRKGQKFIVACDDKICVAK